MFFLFYKIINQFNCFSSTFIRCILYFSFLLLLCVCVYCQQIYGVNLFYLNLMKYQLKIYCNCYSLFFSGFSFRFLLVCFVGFASGLYAGKMVCVHSNCIIIINFLKATFRNLIFIEGFQYCRKCINQWSKIASSNNPLCSKYKQNIRRMISIL